MMNPRLWTILASLLCSLAVSDGAFQLGHDVRLAAIGNPEAVRSLAAVVTRMSGSEPATAPAAAAQRVAVTPVSFTQEDTELVAMAKLIRVARTRAPMMLYGQMAAALGLGSADIAMTQFCLVNKQPAFAIALNVAQVRGADVFVFQQTVGDVSILWNVDREGRVVAVARADGAVTPLPADYKQDVLPRIRKVLFQRLRSEQPSIAGIDPRPQS